MNATRISDNYLSLQLETKENQFVQAESKLRKTVVNLHFSQKEATDKQSKHKKKMNSRGEKSSIDINRQ